MWNLFRGKPNCPVDAEIQQWVDGRFQWLCDQLGKDGLRTRPVVLPTPEFFPDPYEGTDEDAEALLARVAGYMGVNPKRCKLVIYDGARAPALEVSLQTPASPAGLYWAEGATDEQGAACATIGIEQSHLSNPMSLVATLAHEVGHEVLIGQGRVAADQADHEPLTDLLTVFMGMGIFTANATIHDRGYSDGLMASWKTQRLGYLDQRTFGYALARFAWARGEVKPKWMRHVRPDVRVAMKQGLRYLRC